MIRRSFLKAMGAAGALQPLQRLGGAVPDAGTAAADAPATAGIPAGSATGGGAPSRAAPVPRDDRAFWVEALTRIARPVLENLAAGRLRARMPVETRPGAGARAEVTHLEAFGRTLTGIAPWLELGPDPSPEGRLRGELAQLAQRALANAVDPASPDYLNWNKGEQPLVDAAFLGHALLRAPRVLRESMDAATRARLVQALESTRRIVPYYSNWLLFSAMVEIALWRLAAPWDATRVDLALRKLREWYLGDGTYGDGPEYHWDYYNSYVIQPFLLDILGAVRERRREYGEWYRRQLEVSRRYAQVQERLIAPDGTFPVLGRSMAYRFGAFQLLAQVALMQELPAELPAAQVRSALSAVIGRVMAAPGTFDANGWLRIGLAGAQPELAEFYISTGSLYLATTVFLPLGLPPGAPFWADPPRRWTSQRAWGGENIPADHAL